MVTKDSAAPSRPTEDPHDQLPRDVDHSGLPKFHDRSDRDYEIFRQRIVDCIQGDTRERYSISRVESTKSADLLT